MNVLLLGGFLGAGKTSVLMHLARCLVDQSSGISQTPVAILENEVSDNGVDSTLLRSKGYQVSNVFGGCVCCTASAFLPYSVKQIVEDFNPEWLIIEATGMAFPHKIRDSLENELGMDCITIAVADAKRWKRVASAMSQFVESQLGGASLVLVTKVDIVDKDEEEAVCEMVHACAPHAFVVPICAIEPYDEAFWLRIVEVLFEKEKGCDESGR